MNCHLDRSVPKELLWRRDFWTILKDLSATRCFGRDELLLEPANDSLSKGKCFLFSTIKGLQQHIIEDCSRKDHHCGEERQSNLKHTLVAIVVRLLRRLKKPSRNDDSSLPTVLLFYFFFVSMFGKNPVNKPIKGRNAQTLNTYSILVESASFPNSADPIPPMPKAKPKNKPATKPTLPGISSCA